MKCFNRTLVFDFGSSNTTVYEKETIHRSIAIQAGHSG